MSRAARFARAHRRLTTAAVTGTNGKTTTTSMIDAIVAASGEPSARLTTLGAWVDGRRIEGSDPSDEFLHCVETAVAAGARVLALETTSKALAAGFARRWRPSVAVFTNLSHDHLDLHGSPEAYLAAKAQLFASLPEGGVAVLNADDPVAPLLDEVTPAHARRLRYGYGAGADLRVAKVEVTLAGTRVALRQGPRASALGGELRLSVHGEVHAENALAAALAGEALGYGPEVIRRGLETFGGVPGRFEVVARAPLVVVDYAHTPDGLRRTLRTARSLGARLICVFGCGGERDRAKRPAMGAVAHGLADLVVLTNDNPRREAPEAIAAAIERGRRGPGARWLRILDRGKAIRAALAQAQPSDVVVLAGRGHESMQDLGGQAVPFDDAAVARALLAEGR